MAAGMERSSTFIWTPTSRNRPSTWHEQNKMATIWTYLGLPIGLLEVMLQPSWCQTCPSSQVTDSSPQKPLPKRRRILDPSTIVPVSIYTNKVTVDLYKVTILLGLFSSVSRPVWTHLMLCRWAATCSWSQRWPSSPSQKLQVAPDHLSVCPPQPRLIVCGYDQMMARLTTCGRASLVVGNQQAPPPSSWVIRRMKWTRRREENRESSHGNGDTLLIT